jgi:hypothetical protein
MAERETVKVTFNLPADELAGLRDLAADQHLTVTDTIRKAIATEKFLQENLKGGTKLLLQHPDKTYERVVLR